MNTTGKVQIVESSFSIENTGNCNLLLRISDTSLSYAIVSAEEKELKVLFHSALEDVEGKRSGDFFKDDRLLNQPFAKIQAAVETSAFTFIPAELYSEDNLQDYSRFIGAHANSKFLVSDLKRTGAKCISAFPAPQLNALETLFSQVELYNPALPLIESLLSATIATGWQLLLQFNSTNFEVLILNDGKLHLYNIYSIQTATDFNYFLLLILQQLNLKPEILQLTISGEIEKNDDKYAVLQKYFKKITLANPDNFIKEDGFFKEIPPHRFFGLLSLSLCE
ncbi:DUF3822 family protein [Rubrolithibacter danxiaensis]|uniref:DUF3822 family protein n=1 Tax=Rubrolithibacter danxiaensis TaxID=3390805 RepID=UPI003BF775BB